MTEQIEEIAQGEEVAEQPTVETPAAEAETEEQKEARESEEQQQTEKKPWYKKRFDELTWQREEERRRADRLEEALRSVVEQKQPQPKPEEFTPTRPKPSKEEFDYDDDKYVDALTDWKIEQVEAKRHAEHRRIQDQQKQGQAAQAFESARVKTVEAGKAKHADFEQVVYALPPTILTQDLAVAIFETDAPEDVAYYLGKNPAEAAKVAALPPYKKAIALGRIEAKLSTPERKTTTAPPPPNPVGGRETGKIDPDRLLKENPREWIRLRNEGKI